MFTKLRNRFLILNMTIISFVMIAAFMTIYFITYNNIQSENQQKLSNVSTIQEENLSSTAITKDDINESKQSNDLKMTDMTNYSLSFSINVDNDRNITQINSVIDMPDTFYANAAKIALEHENGGTITLDGKQWLFSITPTSMFVGNSDEEIDNTKYGGETIKFLDITDSQKTLTNLLLTFLFVALVMLVVIFFISLHFANFSIKPISKAWEQQQQFISDASHELKTPLSIITANYDVLLANAEETIESQMKWMEYIKIGTDKMSKLINDLLSLTKMEDISIEVTKVPFDMSNLIENVIKAMEARLKDKEINLQTTIEPNIIVNSDAEMIKQLFSILYDNAIKYVDEKGNICVTVKKVKHGVICTVKNSGDGIDKIDLDKIFDRFYRGDTVRSSESGSYGLGLPIAKTIMERLGGEIHVSSTESEGTVFTFKV